MYKYQDRHTKPLFGELFPFGGKLDKENRWIKIAELTPWKELEETYAHVMQTEEDHPRIVGLSLGY